MSVMLLEVSCNEDFASEAKLIAQIEQRTSSYIGETGIGFFLTFWNMLLPLNNIYMCIDD
jgi:hypothetical protein